MLKGFFEHIYDRHLIYHKKEVLKELAPWTNDPIFSKYKFCNSFRELDRGSVYIIKRVINNYELDFKNKLFNIVAYRFFNSYGLFENFFDGLLNIDTFDFKFYEKLLDDKIQYKSGLYSDAYTTCQVPFSSEYRKSDKHIQNLLKLNKLKSLIEQDSYIDRFLNKKSPYDQISVLKEIKTVGPFLAAQIYLDIVYTKEIPFTGEDVVVIGPGAEAGINIIAPDIKSNQYIDYIKYLRDKENFYFKILKEEGKDWNLIKYNSPYQRDNSKSSLTNLQHNLCERRKYLNLINPDKSSRKRYYGRM